MWWLILTMSFNGLGIETLVSYVGMKTPVTLDRGLILVYPIISYNTKVKFKRSLNTLHLLRYLLRIRMWQNSNFQSGQLMIDPNEVSIDFRLEWWHHMWKENSPNPLLEAYSSISNNSISLRNRDFRLFKYSFFL